MPVLSKDMLLELQKAFSHNEPLAPELASAVVNSVDIGVVLNRTASTIRRWGNKPDAPLYGVLRQLGHNKTARAEWVSTLGEVWSRHGQFMDYRSGPPRKRTVAEGEAGGS